MRYWIFKTEPGCFSLADLKAAPNHVTAWDGVRNYQARNFMRDDMRLGDLGLFYHSGKNPEVAGLVEIVKEGYPDCSAQDALSGHFDPAATPGNPRWFMVDVRLARAFTPPVPRALLRRQPDLSDMELLRQGSRLSVLPCEERHFRSILALADRLATR
ncbi:MAG: EVE domain-containing protein [Desulfovibrionaceae bacterium]|nr:EVE domain-containing protein [Desulfovibrionaceae bacterium]